MSKKTSPHAEGLDPDALKAAVDRFFTVSHDSYSINDHIAAAIKAYLTVTAQKKFSVGR